MSSINLLSPQVDIVFKEIFGTEQNKDSLISLINSIVSKEDKVVDITITNPFTKPKSPKKKKPIMDIKATGVNGRKFNIEIQVNPMLSYEARALYYWSCLYSEDFQEGELYNKLTKTIGIHFLNFNLYPNDKDYHNSFGVKELRKNFRAFSNLEMHTIELKKFEKKTKEELLALKDDLDQWVAFLTNYEILDKEKNKLNSNLQKALTNLEIMSYNPKQRMLYEARLKAMSDRNTEIFTAEERGREEGIEKGKFEIAKKMLAKKKDLSEISEFTGLSAEQIKSL